MLSFIMKSRDVRRPLLFPVYLVNLLQEVLAPCSTLHTVLLPRDVLQQGAAPHTAALAPCSGCSGRPLLLQRIERHQPAPR